MVKTFVRSFIAELAKIPLASRLGYCVVLHVSVLTSIYFLYKNRPEMLYGMGWISTVSLLLAIFLNALLLRKILLEWKLIFLTVLGSCLLVLITLTVIWAVIQSLLSIPNTPFTILSPVST